MRILVVDDENVSRKKMEILLRAYGYIDSVETGTAALEYFSGALDSLQPYKLICLDISMPQMSGEEVLKQIRAIELSKRIKEEKHVKVMMVTGMSDRDTVKCCKLEGCDNFIVKPFTRETVIAKMHAMGFYPIH